MAKGISSGINRPTRSDEQRAEDQQARQWKVFKNRIDVILLSNTVMKTADVQSRCSALDGMTPEERRQHIMDYWGPLYLNKVEPMLQQLEILERSINPSN